MKAMNSIHTPRVLTSLFSLITIFVFTAIVGLGSAFAQSTTYHVSKNGSDTDAGTSANPFATIAKAISVAEGGDTIIIEGGVYAESVTFSADTLIIEALADEGGSSIVEFNTLGLSSKSRITFSNGGTASFRSGNITVEDSSEVILSGVTYAINTGSTILLDDIDRTANAFSSVGEGAFSFPANISLSYGNASNTINQNYTTGIELPDSLGTGTLTIDLVQGKTLTLSKDVVARNLNFGSDANVSGGKTITSIGATSAVSLGDTLTNNVVLKGYVNYTLDTPSLMTGSLTVNNTAGKPYEITVDKLVGDLTVIATGSATLPDSITVDTLNGSLVTSSVVETTSDTVYLGANKLITGNLNVSSTVKLGDNAKVNGAFTVTQDVFTSGNPIIDSLVVSAADTSVRVLGYSGGTDSLSVTSYISASGDSTITIDLDALVATAASVQISADSVHLGDQINNVHFGSLNISEGASFKYAPNNADTLIVNGSFTNAGAVLTDSSAVLVFAGNSDATFSPGSAFSVGSFWVNKPTKTLTVANSFRVGYSTVETDTLVNLVAGTIALGNNTITVDSAGVVSSKGTFTNTTSSLGGIVIVDSATVLHGANFSNIRIALPSSDDSVFVDSDSLTFTGTLELFRGHLAITDGDVYPVNDGGQLIKLNKENGTSIIAHNTGTFNSEGNGYNLEFTGELAAVGTEIGSELSSDVENVTVSTTGSPLELKTAKTINGNLTVSTGSQLALAGSSPFDLTVKGNLTVNGAIRDSIASNTRDVTIVLSGDNKTHTIGGMIDDSSTVSTLTLKITGDSRLEGAGSTNTSVNRVIEGSVIVDGNVDVTIDGIKNITSNFTINDSANVNLAMLAPSTIGGDLVLGSSNSKRYVTSLTLSDSLNVAGNVTLSDSTTLTISGSAVQDLDIVGNLTLESATIITSSGAFINMITDGATISADSSSIRNLKAFGDLTINEDLVITESFDADSAVNLSSSSVLLTINGSMDLGQRVYGPGTTKFVGTSTLTLGVYDSLEVDKLVVDGILTLQKSSPSTTIRTLNVDSTFTFTSGSIALNIDTLNVNNTTYAAGEFSGSGVLATRGTVETNNKTLTVGKLFVKEETNIGVADTAFIVVNTSLEISDSLKFARRASTMEIADGLTISFNSADAHVNDTLTYAGNVNFIYNGPANVSYEVRGASGKVDNITVGSNTIVPSGFDVAVNDSLILDATFTTTDTVLIADGGVVKVNSGGSIGSTNFIGDEYKVLYTADATVGAEIASNNVIVEVNDGTNSDVTLTLGSTTSDTLSVIILGANDVLDLTTDTLTLTGNFTAATGASINGSGAASLKLEGSAPQTIALTTDLTIPDDVDVVLNNDDNVTVTGADIIMGSGTFTFTDGILVTGANAIEFGPTSSYTVSDSSYVQGKVTQTLRTDSAGAEEAERIITFPVGGLLDASGATTYSPVSITYDPDQVATTTKLTVGHSVFSAANAIDTLGTNGFPIADGVAAGVDLARYPDTFYWTLASNVDLPSSFTYDMKVVRKGYSDFSTGAATDVEDMRIIRRSAASNENRWQLQGDAANYIGSFQTGTGATAYPTVIVEDVTGGLTSGDGVVFTYALKSNFAAATVDTFTINVGQSKKAALAGGVFTGGTGTYTYTLTNSAATVATGAIANDTLTVTGVGVGTTNMTITAIDALNDSVVATAVAVVSAKFTADTLADYTASVGDASTFNLASIFSGGSGDYTFAATSSDTAKVTVAVSTSDVLTVTAKAVGSATVTVTATDEAGVTETVTFTVTVDNLLAKSGTVPVQVLNAGDGKAQKADTVALKVSTYFAGGTGTIAYTITNGDAAAVSATISKDTLTLIALDPSTADDSVTVTVTATDSLGKTATQAVYVQVVPADGDVSGDGLVNSADAVLVLNSVVGKGEYTAVQIAAMDANGDGKVNSFDAALILQYSVGKIKNLDGSAKTADVNGKITWGETELIAEEGLIKLPLVLETRNGNGTFSVDFAGTFNAEQFTVESVEFTELPEGWLTAYTVSEEGSIKVAMAGATAMSDRQVALLTLRKVADLDVVSISGTGFVNGVTYDMAELAIREIPTEFALEQNYPNPFNPSTSIKYALPEVADVKIEVYNVMGQRVQTLVNARGVKAGTYTLRADFSSLASGMYIYKIEARSENQSFVQTKMMTLIK